MKKGFDRLRGVAAASAMGLGLIGAGSARAASTALPIANLTRGTAIWKTVQNQSPLFSGTFGTIVTDTSQGFSHFAGSSLTAFAIADVSASGFAEAFNNALHLAVNGVLFVNPDTSVDLTGDTVSSDTRILAGVDTEIQYYFHPVRPVVRAMYSFKNTSSSEISIKALVAGALSSDLTTTIQGTSIDSSSPVIADDQDLWRVSNDQTNFGTNSSTDPAITLTRFGTGASVIPVSVLTLGDDSFSTGNTGDPDNFGERYDISIAAGETARILVFAEISKTIAEATSSAVDFASMDAAFTAGMLTGLSFTEVNEVVNYGALGATTTPDSATSSPADEDEETGALNLTALTTLLGLLTLVRVGRNKKA